MTEPGRPTIRCLRDDLQHEWEDVDQFRVVSADALHDLDVPLHDLRHPVIRHMRDVFNGSMSSDVQRESISGLNNPMWYKLKTGRWRGAVYVDPDGKAWLCAAGLRRRGEATDFYRSFMAQIKISGPTGFLPTDADLARVKVETAEAKLRHWEQTLHLAGQAAFRGAVESATPTPLPVASLRDDSVIARALIEVVEISDEDNSLIEVTVEFSDIDWASAQFVERAQEVLMLAICNEPTAWQPGHSTEAQTFSLQSTDGLAFLLEALQDVSLAGLPAEPRLSHWAKKDLILGSAVNGDAVATLCGVWLVQSRDAESLPKCPKCDEIYRELCP